MNDQTEKNAATHIGAASELSARLERLPGPEITTALVLDEVGRRIPMKLIGAYYTADQMREAIAAEREACAKLCMELAACEENTGGFRSGASWCAERIMARSNVEVTGAEGVRVEGTVMQKGSE